MILQITKGTQILVVLTTGLYKFKAFDNRCLYLTIDKHLASYPLMNILTEFPTKLTQQMHFTEHQALSTTVKETCYKVMVIKTYNMPVQFGHHIQVKNIQSLEAIQRKV